LVESYIRTATKIGSMNEIEVLEHFGEVSRVLRYVPPLSADQVAEKVIQLYSRHSTEVGGVMDAAFSAHASNIREGKLPPTCAILLAIPEGYKKTPEDEKRKSAGAPNDSSEPTDRERDLSPAGTRPSIQAGLDNPSAQRKRGRPTKISDELKKKALAAKGGKARAQILYGTNYPTSQQIKNVPSILKHYIRKHAPQQS
jgi:hypothetical protein